MNLRHLIISAAIPLALLSSNAIGDDSDERFNSYILESTQRSSGILNSIIDILPLIQEKDVLNEIALANCPDASQPYKTGTSNTGQLQLPEGFKFADMSTDDQNSCVVEFRRRSLIQALRTTEARISRRSETFDAMMLAHARRTEEASEINSRLRAINSAGEYVSKTDWTWYYENIDSPALGDAGARALLNDIKYLSVDIVSDKMFARRLSMQINKLNNDHSTPGIETPDSVWIGGIVGDGYQINVTAKVVSDKLNVIVALDAKEAPFETINFDDVGINSSEFQLVTFSIDEFVRAPLRFHSYWKKIDRFNPVVGAGGDKLEVNETRDYASVGKFCSYRAKLVSINGKNTWTASMTGKSSIHFRANIKSKAPFDGRSWIDVDIFGAVVPPTAPKGEVVARCETPTLQILGSHGDGACYCFVTGSSGVVAQKKYLGNVCGGQRCGEQCISDFGKDWLAQYFGTQDCP